MTDDKLYKKAEQRADAKIGFYHHLYGFITANTILFILNAVTSFGEWWFYWITFMWAIGLIFHFLKVFVLADKLDVDRESMIEEEMKKMKK